MKSRWRRDDAGARVLVDCLDALNPTGSALVAGDATGLIESALMAMGVEATAWHRHAAADKPAQPWPPDGPFDTAILRLPKSRETFEMDLHAVGSRLKPGAPLLVYGANDEGIRSASRPMRAAFGNAETVETRAHCRVVQTVLPDPPPAMRGRPGDWRVDVVADLPGGGQLRWVSYPGVFAHGRLDEGTRLLIGTLPEVPPDCRVLDFGCGAGVIAAAILRRQPRCQIDLLDNDALGLEAAKHNVPTGQTILSDAWRAVTDATYDLIVSNPPIHEGKDKHFRLLDAFITGAPARLRPNGQAWFVTQRTAPTAKLLAATPCTHTLAQDTPRFRVWRMTEGPTE